MNYVIFVAFKEHFLFYFKVLTLLYMRRPGLGAGAGNEHAVGCVQLQDLHFSTPRLLRSLSVLLALLLTHKKHAINQIHGKKSFSIKFRVK